MGQSIFLIPNSFTWTRIWHFTYKHISGIINRALYLVLKQQFHIGWYEIWNGRLTIGLQKVHVSINDSGSGSGWCSEFGHRLISEFPGSVSTCCNLKALEHPDVIASRKFMDIIIVVVYSKLDCLQKWRRADKFAYLYDLTSI